VPRRNETQPNTPPDTKSNTRVPGTMGGRFFMEMGLTIQIQTSQPETSNSPSHSRTQRLGSLLGSSCWHTKVLEYLPAPNLQGADVALVLPAEAGKENALCRKEHRRNGRATKHTQKKTWGGVAVSRVEDALGQLQRQPSHHVGQRRFMRHRKKRPQPSPSRSTFTPFKIRFTSHLTVCAKAHKKLQAHILVPSSWPW
jgi:hypothetical protein